MAKPLLTDAELEPLVAEEDLEPIARPAARAVDKKTGLPLVSPQLDAKSMQLTDDERSDKQRHAFGQGNVSDVGFAQFIKEVIAGRDPQTKAIAGGDPAAVAAEGERVTPAIAGAGAAGKAAKAIASIAPKAGLNAFAESSAKAIANTAKNKIREATIAGLDKIWGIGPLLGLGANAALDAAPGLAKGGAAIAKAAAPVAGPAAAGTAKKAIALPEGNPKPYRGVWSNAVERLRASAPGNPRAQELLSRIDAIPDSGAGTGEVTQGTLGQ